MQNSIGQLQHVSIIKFGAQEIKQVLRRESRNSKRGFGGMAGLTRSLATPLAVQLLITCCTLQLTLLWSKPGAQCLPANKTAYALLPKINAEGPYLGLVIPNTYELYPFLEPDVFEPSATIPSVDLGGLSCSISHSLSGFSVIL